MGVVCCRYASTCQTVGMNIGYFTSFTVFLALNDVDFCNTYLRSSPSEDGHLTLSTYLRAWGWAYAVVTLLVAAFKKEVNFTPAGETPAQIKCTWLKRASVRAESRLHPRVRACMHACKGVRGPLRLDGWK